ncbi:hypothetical protein 2 [Wenling toti-like virus 2]|uniref:RNA-directed RNA polymerase n=1 Tax=Wenling toti-like virus 2 TaxID=1923549 RepID=A0A1L3KFK4_9VIRU|nr:hypothetical protein 2 [Wenling toti-like virus 2]APG76062.1 hypothetical protein 2 [Wenling toti-like virus 2]
MIGRGPVDDSDTHDLTKGLYTYSEFSPDDVFKLLSAYDSEEPIPLDTGRNPIIPMSPKEALRLWPPRTPADTKNPRLTLVDMWDDLGPELRQLLLQITTLDIITMTNLAVWALLWGVDALRKLYSTSALNSPHRFVTITSKISSMIKRVPGSGLAKQMFGELNTLAGFVHEPWPDFIFKDEVPSLAQGGREHGPEWIAQFRASLERAGANARAPVKYITFEEFVKSGKWVTSGAASFGSVEWSHGDSAGTFKARKNMTTDIYTADEIYEIALNWDARFTSRPFTKNELGKIRLAVSSGFAAYLNEAYVFHLFGQTYTKYTGVTLDETPLDGHNRMVTCVSQFAQGEFGLPWDYRRFDHQVSTEEMECMFDHITSKIQHLIPDSASVEHGVLRNVRRAYSHSVLLSAESGTAGKYFECLSSDTPNVLYAPPGHGKTTFHDLRPGVKIIDTDHYADLTFDDFIRLAESCDVLITNRIEYVRECPPHYKLAIFRGEYEWCINLIREKVNYKLAKEWVTGIMKYVAPQTALDVTLHAGEYVGTYLSNIDNLFKLKRQATSGRQKTPEYEITGGLPSGIRGTSVYGNLWNAAMTQTVRDYAKRVLGYDPVTHIALKGDDALLVAKHPAELYVLRVCYAACNLDGNDAKFGICKGQGEFLRGEYCPEAVHGWSTRVIPSITQYKPWGGGSWNPADVCNEIVTAIRATERRAGKSLSPLLTSAGRKWSRITRQSSNWLALPVHMGGYGLLPWRGLVPSRTLPRTRRPLMKFGTKNAPIPSWISMTKDEHAIYSDTLMTMKTHEIDIPGTSDVFVRPWLAALRKCQVTWRFDDSFILASTGSVATTIHDRHRNEESWPRFPERDFKPTDVHTFPTLLKFLREYTQVKRSSEYSSLKVPPLAYYLKAQFPIFWDKVRYFERRGWHRTDAIELAKDQVPHEPALRVNSILTRFIQHTIKPTVLSLSGRRSIAASLYHLTANAQTSLIASPIHRLYLW